MTGRIVDGAAHDRAARRLLAARGSVYAAFDGLGLGFDHDEVLDYLAGSPHFMSLPEDQRGKVAGLCMGFALVVAEDRSAAEVVPVSDVAEWLTDERAQGCYSSEDGEFMGWPLRTARELAASFLRRFAPGTGDGEQ